MSNAEDLRTTARRWVIDERRSEDDVLRLIVAGFDEGPDRDLLRRFHNEFRAASAGSNAWWQELETAYRKSGRHPKLDLVANTMQRSPWDLRRECREHGIEDWRDLRTRFR